MSQSKIEALRNSYRKSAVKQEVMPKLQPIVRPTRDIIVQKYTTALNLRQSTAYDNINFERRIKQLQQELEDYKIEQQANSVYNKQFRILGKLFGNQDLQFDEIRRLIQDLILNASKSNTQQLNHTPFVVSHQNYQEYSLEDQNFAGKLAQLSRQQLKEKLINASRSEFLYILQLGSTIILQNQNRQQRRRKALRELFYQIWQEILQISKKSSQKLLTSVSKSQNTYNGQFQNFKVHQKTVQLEQQLVQKNKQILQLADELQKMHSIVIDKEKQISLHKSNFDLREKQNQFLEQHNQELNYKMNSMNTEIHRLQDRIRQFQQKQHNDAMKLNENKNEIQSLHHQLKSALTDKQNECKQLVTKIQMLMSTASKYDQTIMELETEKSELIRVSLAEKANNSDLVTKLRQISLELDEERGKYLQVQKMFKEKQSNIQHLQSSYEEENHKRIQELNEQLLVIREQFDIKEKEQNNKIILLTRQKQEIQAKLQQVRQEYQMERERESNDAQPHTAVFGGAKLSEQLRTSIIDNRVDELEEELTKQKQASTQQLARLGNQLSSAKAIQMQKNEQINKLNETIRQQQSHITQLQMAIAALKMQNKMLIEQVGSQKILLNESEHASIRVEELNNQLQLKIEQIFNMSTKITTYQSQIQQNKQTIKKIQQYQHLIQNFQVKMQQFIKMEDNYKHEITQIQEHYESKMNAQQADLINAQSELKRRDKQLQDFQAQFAKVQTMLGNLQSQHTQKYIALNKLIADRNVTINQLQIKYKALEAQLQESRNSVIALSENSNKQAQASVSNQLEGFKKRNVQLQNELANFQRLGKEQSIKLNQSQNKITQLQGQILMLNTQIIQLQSNIKSLQETQIHQKQQMRIKQMQKQAKHNEQLKRFQKTFQQSYKYTLQLQEMLKNKQQNMLKLQSQFTTENTHYEQVNKQSNQYKNLVNQLQHKVQQIENELIVSLETIRKKDIYISQMTGTLGSHIQTLDNMGKQMTKIQLSYDGLIEENGHMRKQYESVKAKYDKALAQVLSLNTLNEKLNESLESVKILNETLRNQNNQLKASIQNLREQLIHYQNSRYQQKHEKAVYNNEIGVQHGLKTIKQIAESQSQISRRDAAILINDNSINDRHESSIRLSQTELGKGQQVQYRTANISHSSRAKSNQMIEGDRSNKVIAVETGYNYKLRPAIQKNSARFQAMIRQSQEQELLQNQLINQQKALIQLNNSHVGSEHKSSNNLQRGSQQRINQTQNRQSNHQISSRIVNESNSKIGSMKLAEEQGNAQNGEEKTLIWSINKINNQSNQYINGNGSGKYIANSHNKIVQEGRPTSKHGESYGEIDEELQQAKDVVANIGVTYPHRSSITVQETSHELFVRGAHPMSQTRLREQQIEDTYVYVQPNFGNNSNNNINNLNSEVSHSNQTIKSNNNVNSKQIINSSQAISNLQQQNININNNSNNNINSNNIGSVRSINSNNNINSINNNSINNNNNNNNNNSSNNININGSTNNLNSIQQSSKEVKREESGINNTNQIDSEYSISEGISSSHNLDSSIQHNNKSINQSINNNNNNNIYNIQSNNSNNINNNINNNNNNIYSNNNSNNNIISNSQQASNQLISSNNNIQQSVAYSSLATNQVVQMNASQINSQMKLTNQKQVANAQQADRNSRSQIQQNRKLQGSGLGSMQQLVKQASNKQISNENNQESHKTIRNNEINMLNSQSNSLINSRQGVSNNNINSLAQSSESIQANQPIHSVQNYQTVVNAGPQAPAMLKKVNNQVYDAQSQQIIRDTLANSHTQIYTDRQINIVNEVISSKSNSQGRISYPSYPSQHSYASQGVDGKAKQPFAAQTVSAKQILNHALTQSSKNIGLASIQEMASSVQKPKQLSSQFSAQYLQSQRQQPLSQIKQSSQQSQSQSQPQSQQSLHSQQIQQFDSNLIMSQQMQSPQNSVQHQSQSQSQSQARLSSLNKIANVQQQQYEQGRENGQNSQKTLEFISQTVIKATDLPNQSMNQVQQEHGEGSVYNSNRILSTSQQSAQLNNAYSNNGRLSESIASNQTNSAMSKIIQGSKPVIYINTSNKSLPNDPSVHASLNANSSNNINANNNFASLNNANDLNANNDKAGSDNLITQNDKGQRSIDIEKGSPSVVSEKKQQNSKANQNLSSPSANKSNGESRQSLATPPTPILNDPKSYSFGPNVIQAQSHQTYIQNSTPPSNVFSIYSGSGKQVSLRLDHNQRPLNTNVEDYRNKLNRYMSQPNIGNHIQPIGYPEPNRVMRVQKIQSFGNRKSEFINANTIPFNHQYNQVPLPSSNKQIQLPSQTYVIKNESILAQQLQSLHKQNQVQQVRQMGQSNLRSSSSNVLSPTKFNSISQIPIANISQSRYKMSQKSQSPSSHNHIISNKQLGINPYISSQSIQSNRNLSPPPFQRPIRSGDLSQDRRMYETFNPSSFKRISIYTSKPGIQRPQSQQSSHSRSVSPHQRSLSPPVSSKKIIIQNAQVTGENLKRSRLDAIAQSQMSLQQTLNQRTENRDVNNTAIMMLETKTHRRAQSEAVGAPYSRFYGRPIESAQQSRVQNVSNNDVTSINGRQLTQRPVSNATVSQKQASDSHRSNIEINNVGQFALISSPSATYGIDKVNNGFKSMKFNQVNTKTAKTQNSQIPNYKYTSKPAIQTVWTPSSLAYQTAPHIQNSPFSNQLKTNKQQMREEVFSSKHKIVEGLEDSNSSGIQVQQKGSVLDCCPKC